MKWWQRLLHKKQMEKRLHAELQFHLEHQIADYVRAGMSEEEARRKVRLQFGGLEQVKEVCRDARGTLWVESILQDVRFALRALRQSPSFTITVIGTLALGIGANAAIFQLLDAVRLRSLPVARPQELALVQVEGGNGGFGVINDFADLTYPLWEQIRQHQQGFSDVFAWASNSLFIGPHSQQRHVPVLEISGELFPTLGVLPLKGRLFTYDDDRPGCGLPGAVISYGLWQSEFGGRDSAIGSSSVQRHLGALLDHTGLYSRLTVREHFVYFGELYGLSRTRVGERVDELLAILGLGQVADRRAGELSQGQRMKVALGRAMVHLPRNLLLDEPTNGLDVPTVRALRTLLRETRDAGLCIIFSSHVLEEVQALCDTVVILSHGVSVACGSLEEVCRQTGTSSLEQALLSVADEAGVEHV